MSFLKKAAVILLVFVILMGYNNFLIKNISASSVDVDNIYADTVVLMEMEKGQVLYEKNMHEKKYPASTTKILTALLLLQNSALSEKVEISENAFRVRGSTLHLNIDTTISVRDLLYGIMLRSSNDGAVAAAEHVSDSLEDFIQKMNEKATELGALNTNFENPHGLSRGYPEHKTTAYDLAMITRKALKCPIFRKVVKTTEEKIVLEDGERELYNGNKLLNYYPGANGVKTGYTSSSGYTLVASATNQNTTLIAVVLGSSTRENLFRDAEKLLDYGFENFEKVNLVEKGEFVDTVDIDYDIELDIYANSDINHMIHEKNLVNLSVNLIKEKNELFDSISLPLGKNDKVGTMKLMKGEEKIGKTDLIIKDNINKSSTSSYTPQIVTFVFLAGGIITGFFVLLKNKVKNN